tara:strand:+ start:277 stop:753 length:477 start_codon:yes stop_codon:yes gene_type:complete
MATTLSDAKLTVRIIEDIELNGRKLGNINKHEIDGINEVSERILTVPTTQTTILSASSAIGAGTFLSSSIKYIRLTNLDDTNFVRVSFVSGTNRTQSDGIGANTADFKLEAKRSMFFTNVAFSGSADGATFNAFSDFANLKGTSDTAAVDVELFVAST